MGRWTAHPELPQIRARRQRMHNARNMSDTSKGRIKNDRPGQPE